MSQSRKDCPALIIEPVSVDQYRPFVARYGTSPEVGPIGTYFDPDKDPNVQSAEKVHILGGWAAGTLVAAACFTLTRAREGQNFTLKLDSVIVRPELRRQGLASLLVAHGFLAVLNEEQGRVATIYAHSVHPATVRLLRQHAFSDPNPVGAPISALSLTDDNRPGLVSSLRTRLQTTMTRLKHKCVTCQSGRKGATPWCGAK